MQDIMLSDILVWLLLHNIVADKHILISVLMFARGTKCSGDASFSGEPNSPLCLSLLTLLLAKTAAYYGLFQTTEASGLATPRR